MSSFYHINLIFQDLFSKQIINNMNLSCFSLKLCKSTVTKAKAHML